MQKQIALKLLFILVSSVCYAQNTELPSNTKLADSLDAIGRYTPSITYRELALKEKGHSEDYQLLIEAKYFYTNSCKLEVTGGKDNHSKAVELSLKARDIAKRMTSSNIFFRHEIANRIYHQYGYAGDWNNAFIEAKKNYEILKDTFPDHHPKMLWIIDDLGFVSKMLYDFETSLNYYSKSMPLYTEYHPEKLADVATNYNMMATGYKKLGLRKKECNVLKEAEIIWDNDSLEGHFVSKFTCYEQLAVWNIYYGNTKEAERFLKKQEDLMPNLIAGFKDTERPYLSRSFYARIFYNYIELYTNTKQYDKAVYYLERLKIQFPDTDYKYRFEVNFAGLYYSYLAKLPDTKPQEAISNLKKAIEIVESYDDKFQMDATELKVQMFKLQLENKSYADAERTIDYLLESTKTTDHNLQFFLLSNKANLLAQKDYNEKADKNFRNSLDFLANENAKPLQLETLNIEQLKSFYSYETVDGLVLASQFYKEQYEKTQKNDYLGISKNLVILASHVFDNLYLGERYNENLFHSYKNIERQALSVLTVNSNENDLKSIIEALENNATKFTWSKFIYSKARRNLNIPDSIVNKESELKSLINYYQNELYKKKDERLNLDTLQTRISETKVQLQKLQTFIKRKHATYYNNNFSIFRLSEFQNSLNKNQQVLKYIISDEKLYCFIISKSSIAFEQLSQPKDFERLIEDYIVALKTYNSDINTSLSKLQPIVPQRILENLKTNITIIPDGILCYLSFEALNGTSQFLDSKATISYASSLSLLKVQNTFSNDAKSLTLGYFTADYKGSEQLPSLANEQGTILNSFEGNTFNNLSAKELVQKAKEYDLLHFAVHSTINKENPDFSNFNLGDETLLMSDLYHESFKAKLAVLSACETGGGNFVNGEGIQSASRTFTYTGVPSVVMSLWKVDDASTSKIMSEFYSNLKEGQAKDVALKNAKIHYLESVEDEALKHPYYWAGFVVSGNTDALVHTNNHLYWYLGIGFCALILVFFWKRKINPKR